MMLLLAGKGSALVFQVCEQESVRQAQGGAGAQGRENFLVLGGLGGVGNEQQHQVRLANHVVHLAQRTAGLGEPGGLRFACRAAAGTQAHLHPNAGAFKRFAQVLRLRRPLRSPTNDANLLDAFEGRRQQRKLVPTAAYNPLFGIAKPDHFGFKNLGRKIPLHFGRFLSVVR